MPVILVYKDFGLEKNNRKKWRAKEEERHKGSLTPPPQKKLIKINILCTILKSLPRAG
jgi:hypothetical protein